MAAPTPVSSLVHSSTLVTAGVFLLLRFYSAVCGFRGFFVFVSMLTIAVAGFSAVFDWDIKKIIAYSTLSQLGFMVFFLGFRVGFVLFFFI